MLSRSDSGQIDKAVHAHTQAVQRTPVLHIGGYVWQGKQVKYVVHTGQERGLILIWLVDQSRPIEHILSLDSPLSPSTQL